ncbi:hypothetical protein B0H66DRAFT_558132 [Apodospora peruviana]|uniref:Bet v1-like protein n=1 Tax=Apodospora peruviana TaxID=516989 RepID=A0AAE0M5M4_9PEZI|nr:hypothetical protein B0H66DRAFT_558132 [Apodospora peruviana]
MASNAIATTNEVDVSAVIEAPLAHVWHFIKLGEFHKFWPAIEKAERVKGTTSDSDVYKWTFKDGTSLEVKQDEHSNINHFITYSAINAEPELPYSSMVSTIRCEPVTSGKLENSTFVRWSARFSSDADLGVIEDAKYKRQDALKGLEAAASSMSKA